MRDLQRFLNREETLSEAEFEQLSPRLEKILGTVVAIDIPDYNISPENLAASLKAAQDAEDIGVAAFVWPPGASEAGIDLDEWRRWQWSESENPFYQLTRQARRRAARAFWTVQNRFFLWRYVVAREKGFELSSIKAEELEKCQEIARTQQKQKQIEMLWSVLLDDANKIETAAKRHWMGEEKWNIWLDCMEQMRPGPSKTNRSRSPLTVTAPLALKKDDYGIQTAQEVEMLFLSASRGEYWRNEDSRGARVWEMKGGSHHVEVLRKKDGLSDPVEWSVIERLTDSQNSDFTFAFCYVVRVLGTPPSSEDSRSIIGGWIDLNDIMLKIGWMAEKPNAERREFLRRQIWDFLVYGEEASVRGKRSVPYHDKVTKMEIPTQIESAAWSITDVQRPEQNSLFPDMKPAPVQARIVISEQWEPLFRSPSLAQYFPLGELLGSIPPLKIAGDWARLTGLNLLRHWRLNPQKTLDGERRLTRRELLTHYTPKTRTVQELLNSNDPKRAVEYYRKALNILMEMGIISATGDASKDMTAAKMIEPYKGYGWSEKWLNADCDLSPGPKALPFIQEIAKNQFKPKPRDLQAAHKKPRKTSKTG